MMIPGTPKNEKGPATAPTVPSHGSNSTPSKDIDMNAITNITATATTPETSRPLSLQLLDIADFTANIGSLVDVLSMATSDIADRRQRDAMSAACDVLMARMDDLKGYIEEAREAVQ